MTDKTDRWSKEAADWSSMADHREMEDWDNTFGGRNCALSELYQPHGTHDSAGARSRLDRVYVSSGIAEQLDAQLGCATLDWCKNLSDHRPLVFFRRVGKLDIPGKESLPEGPIKHPSWPLRVALEFQDQLRAEGSPQCALRQLAVLKEAIVNVTRGMHEHNVRHNEAVQAQETDDQLGWTVRCLRAVQHNRQKIVYRCIRAYPKLSELVDCSGKDPRCDGRLEPLKKHAADLARQAVLDELRAIQDDDGKVDDNVQRNRRSRAQVRLNRLRPGSCCTVAALKCADGSMATTPEAIAHELRRHWGEVFSLRAHDEPTLQSWLQEELGGESPFGEDTDWDVSMQHVLHAIKVAPCTAPGPDGIPYNAWKKLGPLGASTLRQAIRKLGEDNARAALCGMSGNGDHQEHLFNLGNMVFLPKKPAGTDPLLGDFYTASDVRPLVIVNTDNRLMASAVRFCLEPILAKWISKNQQGFIKDRSMLANVVDISHCAQLVSLNDDRGGMMLFDFKAAFPSLSHGYMHAVLTALGLPKHILNFVRSLYDNHCCHIVAGGGCFRGFDIKAGIRQGCPLSPLLFALVVDILLRRMQRLCPALIIRAFADDIAVVAPDLYACVPVLMDFFLEAARVAGLGLNIPKCVLIPLWPVDLELVRIDFARHFPGWASMTVDDKGTYLGFVIGPGAGDASWGKPLQKYLKSARFWGKAGVGLQYSALAYTTYVLPILSFVGQLCAPPKSALETEMQAFRHLIPGPGNWCVQNDLWYMADNFGQARNLPSLVHLCMAAQKRVYLWENRAQGGLAIRDRFLQLQRSMSSSRHRVRNARWESWYHKGPVATLHCNSVKMDEWGLSSASLLRNAGWEDIDPDNRAKGVRKVKSKFQSCVRKALALKDRPDKIYRIRTKLERWNLTGIERHTADRFARMLQRLARLVPPRVAQAVWRTAWNGWTTARRFQQTGHRCVLCCNSQAGGDCIEHYARCAVTADLGAGFVGLRAAHYSQWLGNFVVLGVNHGTVNDTTLVKRAVVVYSIYRATNLLRHSPSNERDVIKDMVYQFAREAVRGHGPATKRLEDWASDDTDLQ